MDVFCQCKDCGLTFFSAESFSEHIKDCEPVKTKKRKQEDFDGVFCVCAGCGHPFEGAKVFSDHVHAVHSVNA